MTPITVPLSKLDPSPLNVRKTCAKPDPVPELAASIQSHGLLQNLTVVARGERFEVIAGSMRLRALKQLEAQGSIDADYLVSCNVIDAAQAPEASLTENVTRSAMHPADEFDAFYRLTEDGATVADIAARFGKNERYVQQRLRLALVSPTILQAYRDGEATLEQMTALAVTDDQARQLRVWKAARSPWEREPQRLRAAVVDGEINVARGIGRFVGAAAYEKAGGVVRRDLFGSDEDSYLTDSELVNRLAREKLERTAEKIRKEGWKWVETRVQFGYAAEDRFGTIYPGHKGNKEVWTDEQKAHAGVVVSIAHNGYPEIHRGLVRPQDRKAVTQATGRDTKSGKSVADRKAGDLSFAAVQRLQAEAGQIVALELAKGAPIVALALLAAELADDVFYSGWNDTPRTWVNIQRASTNRTPGAIRKEVAVTPAHRELAEIEAAWGARFPKKRSELRAWLLAQEAETVLQLLAFLVARETEAVDVSAAQAQGVVDLAKAAGVDLSVRWAPTVEWLASLPKNVTLAMAKDAGAPSVKLAEIGRLPKAKLAEAAFPLFPAGWLPKVLRAPEAKRARKPRAVAKKTQADEAYRSDFPWSAKQ